MSVLGLSIIVMAVVATAALLATLVAESVVAATPLRRFEAAGTVPASPSQPLRCRPRILPKCPQGETRVCLELKDGCCVKFGCRKSQ